ncbi:MAG: cellulose biosynthesis protein BcsG [Rhodoferax sp.]|nr:cellulose biosynthesis protein BcsG [Rhodoferax sp.]
MNYLGLYFLLKTGLYYTHSIGFHWIPNLLLALLAFWPLQPGLWRRLRPWVLWPAAIALLYYDAYLPSIERVWSQIGAISGFSNEYLLELLGRIFQPAEMAMLLGAIVLYTILSRWLRFATFAILAILSVPLVAAINNASAPPTPTPAPTATTTSTATTATNNTATNTTEASPDAQLQAFYAKENQRRLVFPKPASPPPFDIVMLHVCSMSWDDLDFVEERNTPLLKRFDLVFSNFNSAASYSGPAAIRVLRGTCGQTKEEGLFKEKPEECATFPSLAKAGYQTAGLLNHNGIYYSFAKIVAHEAGLDGRLESNKEVPVIMNSFDGTPVYDDYALLSRWWTQRQTHSAQPVALYYNSITLHDGNRVPGTASLSSLQTYKPRITKLLADLDRFVTQLEASGKPVLLLLIPEHGGALRREKGQLVDGIREIPDPKISLVPAAIKLVGLKTATQGTPPGAPILVDQPVSYFGLFSLVADLLADNPYTAGTIAWNTRLEKLQTTPFVAQNGDIVVMSDSSGRYIMKSSDGTWVPTGK